MKEFKAQIIEAIIAKSESDKIISLYEVGTAMGHKHISAQDCRDILGAVRKRLPDYKAVKMVKPGQSDATASLWTTLTFIDKTLEFCDHEDP